MLFARWLAEIDTKIHRDIQKDKEKKKYYGLINYWKHSGKISSDRARDIRYKESIMFYIENIKRAWRDIAILACIKDEKWEILNWEFFFYRNFLGKTVGILTELWRNKNQSKRIAWELSEDLANCAWETKLKSSYLFWNERFFNFNDKQIKDKSLNAYG